MNSSSTCLRVLRFLLCSALLVGGVQHADADDFRRAKKKYDEQRARPSLRFRTQGRIRLAQSRDLRALEILQRDYAKPEKPQNEVRWLIASLAPYYCDENRHVEAYEAWRKAHAERADAWLWFETLRVHAEHLGSRDLIEALGTEQDVLLRLCGLEALAANRSFGLFKALRAALDALPEKAGFARWRWMESSAAALHGMRNKAKSDDFRPLALAVIAWLDDKEVPEDTKLVIARHLARTFGSEHVTLKSVFWRDALDAEQSLTPPDERYVSDPPTFMGLRAWGKRIVYLIDMSDSMLEPITNEERTRLGAPITGGDEKRPKRDKKDEDGEIEVGDLPWHRIETRFDLAREYLKQSLAGLPKDRYFMVVGFGSEAETLKSTKRFVAAKKKTIRKVLKELDKIKPGRATDVRPNGTLRGDTNMHAAFRLAFQAGKKGPMRGDAALDEEGFEHGCDTIFLLSDGAPTVDDFMAVDQVPAGSGGYRDRETGKSLGGGGGAAPPPGSMVPAEIQGPYGSDDVHIVDDIRRMNLFRKAEIHCVGIGKAKMRLLKRLAEAGLGKARRFDADEDDEDEDDDE